MERARRQRPWQTTPDCGQAAGRKTTGAGPEQVKKLSVRNQESMNSHLGAGKRASAQAQSAACTVAHVSPRPSPSNTRAGTGGKRRRLQMVHTTCTPPSPQPTSQSPAPPPIPPTQSETYMEGKAQQSTKETQEHVQLGRSIRLFQRHRLQHKRDCRVGPPRVIVCRPADSGGRPRHVRRGEG